jgi:hypothetical protein
MIDRSGKYPSLPCRGGGISGIIIFFMALLALAGCSSTQEIRSGLEGWAKSDVKNVEILNKIALDLKITWPFWSGAIESYNEYHPLEPDIMDLKRDLDSLQAKAPWTYRESGMCLTLRGLLLYEFGDEAAEKIEKILPGFLDILKFL